MDDEVCPFCGTSCQHKLDWRHHGVTLAGTAMPFILADSDFSAELAFYKCYAASTCMVGSSIVCGRDNLRHSSHLQTMCHPVTLHVSNPEHRS